MNTSTLAAPVLGAAAPDDELLAFQAQQRRQI